jgi:hypothetical protein
MKTNLLPKGYDEERTGADTIRKSTTLALRFAQYEVTQDRLVTILNANRHETVYTPSLAD